MVGTLSVWEVPIASILGIDKVGAGTMVYAFHIRTASVVYTLNQIPSFEADAIMARVRSHQELDARAETGWRRDVTVDDSEQLRHLAALRDDRIITVEDFEVKKRQILGI